jgi:hypothetical protein
MVPVYLDFRFHVPDCETLFSSTSCSVSLGRSPQRLVFATVDIVDELQLLDCWLRSYGDIPAQPYSK